MDRRFFGLLLAGLLIISSCQRNDELDSGLMTPELKRGVVEQTDANIIPGQFIIALNEFPGAPKGRAVGYEEGIRRAREVIGGLMNEYRIPAARLGYVYAFALDGFSAQLTDEQANRLVKDRRVKYVEPDQVISLSATQTNATWGLDRVDQEDLPLDRTYSYTTTGTGVTAYIIDTGIRFSHSEFEGRASFGFDAFGGSGADGNGHGTHVAGTVGGKTYGIAKKVNLVAVRVLNNSGSGSTSGVVAGMDWVAGDAKIPAVANMSLGGGASVSIDNAVTRMFNKGIAVIVAAGNSNANACDFSPARAEKAYTIGATTSTDVRASYSNFGDCVDLFAPGSSITSAWFTNNTATKTISGTSMASPHVAGAAALYLESNSNASPQQVYDALTANSTRNKVTSANTVNNHLLYTLTSGGTTPVNAPPLASFTFSTNNLTASFSASGSSDPGGNIVSYTWNFGDGNTGTGVTPSHTYAAAGNYSVTLTVTDNLGATGTQTQSISVTSTSVNTPPLASFTYDLSNLNVTFDASGSSDSDGNIVSYAWTFGDGNTGTGVTPSHTYAAAGNYSVILTVTDNVGATGTQTQSVTVTEPLAGNIVLVSAVKRVQGVSYADLTWNNAAGTSVLIKVNGRDYLTTGNDGFESVKLGKVTGVYTFQVCETDNTRCSEILSITY